jgi:hypothetical protein
MFNDYEWDQYCLVCHLYYICPLAIIVVARASNLKLASSGAQYVFMYIFNPDKSCFLLFLCFLHADYKRRLAHDNNDF